LFEGGPNEKAQAGVAPKEKGALSYADDARSYATNEYAIDYNASLIALIGMVMKEEK
jgi:endoglucanase